MSDNLSILITAKLNEILSKDQINSDLAKLATQINKLDVKINIDQSAYKDLIGQIQEVNKLSKQLKLFDKQQLTDSGAELHKSLDDVLAKYQGLGTIKLNNTLDPLTKGVTGFILEIDKANGIVDKFKYNLVNVGSIDNKMFMLDGLKQTDTTAKVNQKAALDNEKFLNDLDKAHFQALRDNAQRDQKEFESSLKQKELLDKAHFNALQEDAKRNLKEKEAILKQEEALDKSHYMALRQNAILDQKEYETSLKQKELLDKAHYQALQEQSKRQSQADQGAYNLDYYKQDQTRQVSYLQQKYDGVKDTNNVPINTHLDDYLKQVNALSTATPNLSKELDGLKLKFKEIGDSAKIATGDTMGFGDAFATALIKFPVWMAATTIFIQSMKFFSDGVKYVNDFNATLTQIGTAVNYNVEKQQQLGQSFQQLGKEISASTKDVASGALEFYRQGLGDEQVIERLKTTTMYAKISGLEFKQSAEVLTAATNSMNQDINKVSDTFTLLGDLTATSASEIGVAFQKVGGTAESLKVPFDKVASYIATISAQTRESAETVGSSVKSIFARIGSVKEKGYDAQDGTSINQVSKALEAAQVHLVDSQGQFRNFATVLDELGAKWNSIDDKTRRYIATTVAGTYQQSRFLTLMDNYGKSVELYNRALDSTGTTTQKYGIYLQSTGAQIDRLKNSMQGLWSDTFKSDQINIVLETIVKLTDGIGFLIHNFGFLPPVIFAASTAFFAFNKTALASFWTTVTSIATEAIPNLIKGIGSLSTWTKSVAVDFQVMGLRAITAGSALAGLRTVMMSLLSITGTGLLFAGITMGLTTLIGKWQEHRQVQQETDQQNQKMAQTYMHQGEEIDRLVSKYSELDKATSHGSVFADSSQQQEYFKVSTDLSKLLPTLTHYVDENGQAHLKTASAVRENVDAIKALSNAEAFKILNTSKDNYDAFVKDQQDTLKKIESLKQSNPESRYKGISVAGAFFSDEKKQEIDAQIKALEAQMKIGARKVSDLVKGIAEAFNTTNGVKLDKTGQGVFDQIISSLDPKQLDSYGKIQVAAQAISKSFQSVNSALTDNGKVTQEVIDQLKSSLSGVNGINVSVFDDLQNSIKKTVDAQKEHVTTLDELAQEIQKLTGKDGSIDLLNKGEAELVDNHKLSQDTLDKLISKYGDFIKVTDLVDSKMLQYIKTKKTEETSFIGSERNKTQVFIEETTKRIQALQLELAELAKAIDQYSNSSSDSVFADKAYKRKQIEITQQQKDLQDALDKLKYIDKSSANAFDNTYLSTNKNKQAIDEYTKSIAELDLALERIKYELGQYPKSSQQYRDGLQKELDLIQKKISLTEQQIALNGKANSTVSISPTSGFASGVNPYADQKASEIGLTKTSGYRTPQESIAVGGHANDDHTKGLAEDFAGSVDKMNEFAKWATSSGLFSKVLWQGKDQIQGYAVDGHYDHVHVSWNQPDANTPLPSGVSKEDFDKLNKQQQDLLKYKDELVKVQQVMLESRTAALDNQLQQLDTRIKISDSVMQKQNKTSEQYRSEITLQIDLLKQKQSIVSQEADMIRNSGLASDELTSKTNQLSTAWHDFQAQIDKLNLANLDSQLAQLEQRLTDIDFKLKVSDIEMSRYKDTSTEYRTELSKQINLLREKQDVVHKEAEAIRASGITTDDMKNKLQQLTTTWWDYQSTIESVNKKISDITSKVADDIVATYKQMYEQQKTAELAALDERNKAEQKHHDDEMKRLDKEMNAYQGIIDAKLKSIDQQATTDDYNKQLAALQKERTDIQKQIDVLSLDNSIEAKAKRVDLEKQLTDKNQSITDLTTNRQRDLRKQNLTDQLDAYKKDIDAKKQAEDDKFKLSQDEAQKERDTITRKYDNMLNDERSFAKLRKDILEGNLTEVNKNFESFTKFLSDHAKVLGESITTNLIDKIKELKAELEVVNNMKASSNPFGMSADDFNRYLKNKKDYEAGINQQQAAADNQGLRDKYGVGQDQYSYNDLKNYGNTPTTQTQPSTPPSNALTPEERAQLEREMADHSAEWHTANAERKKWLEARNQEIGAKLGKKYDSNTGTWTFDEGGFVGDAAPSKIASIFNKLFNDKPDRRVVQSLLGELQVPPKNLPNMVESMKMMISNITPNVQVAGAGGNTYQAIIQIDKFNGTQNDYQTLEDRTMNTLKKLGMK